MSEQQLENLWSSIPQVIMSRKDINPAAKLVYGYIDGWTRNGKDCWATNETIGNWCGMSERSASSAVGELIENKLVFCTYDKDNKRHLQSTPPLAIVATPSSNSCVTPLATVATYYNKDIKIKDKPPAPKKKKKPAAADWMQLAYADAAFIDAFNSTSKRDGCKYDWEAWLAIPATVDKNALSAAFIAKCKATKEPKYQPQLRKFIESYVFDAHNPRNNTMISPKAASGQPQPIQGSQQTSRKLLMASGRFPNIPADWMKTLYVEDEMVLDYINRQYPSISFGSANSAKNAAIVALRQQTENVDIFSEMLKKGIDNTEQSDKTE